ncbi:Uncharacterized protein Fot_09107 [Forsythia ovata]|uniref:Uncharacterized protein n=1 Tax=Forsythia ovata TaxID=205694 RepID=A0ABD1WDD3_9LAMI
MEGSGRHIIAAAVAISGCSLLLMSYLVQKIPRFSADRSPGKSTTIAARKQRGKHVSSTKNLCSATGKVRKQVRFLDNKDAPNDEKLLRRKTKTSMSKSHLGTEDKIWSQGKKKRMNLPDNWNNLYNDLPFVTPQVCVKSTCAPPMDRHHVGYCPLATWMPNLILET